MCEPLPAIRSLSENRFPTQPTEAFQRKKSITEEMFRDDSTVLLKTKKKKKRSTKSSLSKSSNSSSGSVDHTQTQDDDGSADSTPIPSPTCSPRSPTHTRTSSYTLCSSITPPTLSLQPSSSSSSSSLTLSENTKSPAPAADLGFLNADSGSEEHQQINEKDIPVCYCTEPLETLFTLNFDIPLELLELSNNSKAFLGEDKSPSQVIPRSLMWVLLSGETGTSLVESAIRSEIKNTPSPMLLLREESIYTRALSQYANLEGYIFLEEVLKKAVKKVTKKNNISFEIHPSREPNESDRKLNGLHVYKACRDILDTIVAKTANLSINFRRVFNIIKEEVESKFPGHGKRGVAVSFFLRFFSPNLVQPEQYNLSAALEPEKRRRLITCGQVLQNLINSWSICLIPPHLISKDINEQQESFLTNDGTFEIVQNLLPKYSQKLTKLVDSLINPKKGNKSIVASYLHWKDAEKKVDEHALEVYKFIMINQSLLASRLSDKLFNALSETLKFCQEKNRQRSKPRIASAVKVVWTF